MKLRLIDGGSEPPDGSLAGVLEDLGIAAGHIHEARAELGEADKVKADELPYLGSLLARAETDVEEVMSEVRRIADR